MCGVESLWIPSPPALPTLVPLTLPPEQLCSIPGRSPGDGLGRLPQRRSLPSASFQVCCLGRSWAREKNSLGRGHYNHPHPGQQVQGRGTQDMTGGARDSCEVLEEILKAPCRCNGVNSDGSGAGGGQGVPAVAVRHSELCGGRCWCSISTRAPVSSHHGNVSHARAVICSDIQHVLEWAGWV